MHIFFYRVTGLQTNIQSSVIAAGFSGTVVVGTPAIAMPVCAKQTLNLHCVDYLITNLIKANVQKETHLIKSTSCVSLTNDDLILNYVSVLNQSDATLKF